MSSGPLDEAYGRARATWPGVQLEQAAFEAHVAPRATGDATLHTDDLYLACACLRGDRSALEAFERAFAPPMRLSLNRFDLSAGDREDLLQTLRVKFFLKGQLAGYSGRGSLKGWVSTAATRAALDAVSARKQRPDDEEELLGSLPATGDPELDLIRTRFAAEFKTAFTETMRELPPEDRVVLAQHYIDKVSIDQAAALEGVHRATAARRLVRVRDALLEGTRARLETRLAIDGRTLESLMRLAGSRLEVSVFRLMRDDKS